MILSWDSVNCFRGFHSRQLEMELVSRAQTTCAVALLRKYKAQKGWPPMLTRMDIRRNWNQQKARTPLNGKNKLQLVNYEQI